MLRTDRDFLPLRLLYAFSLGNFIKAMGPGPFAIRQENGGGDAKAAERIKLAATVVAAWSREASVRAWPALQKQFVELSAIFSKHRIIAPGKNGGK